MKELKFTHNYELYHIMFMHYSLTVHEYFTVLMKITFKTNKTKQLNTDHYKTLSISFIP